MKWLPLGSALAVCGAALLGAGCQSAPDVRSDYDKSVDFGRYRTYNFVPNPSTDQLGYSSLVTQQLEVAINTQMQQRGYTLADHPDLFINFSGKLQQMQDVKSAPSAVGPYYGYRTGFYGVWPGYSNDVYTVNYTQGTLNIDLIDPATKRMVWEGVGVGEVTKAKLADRTATLNAAVADIFMKFPFRAGEGQPTGTTAER
jgi:hypothetical protein